MFIFKKDSELKINSAGQNRSFGLCNTPHSKPTMQLQTLSIGWLPARIVLDFKKDRHEQRGSPSFPALSFRGKFVPFSVRFGSFVHARVVTEAAGSR